MTPQQRTQNSAKPIVLVSENGWPAAEQGLPEAGRAFAQAHGFKGNSGAILAIPDASGRIERVLFGTGNDPGLAENPFLAGRLATDLPAGEYAFDTAPERPDLAYLGFLLGRYRFTRYKAHDMRAISLAPPAGCDTSRVEMIAVAIAAGRDLINTPANDMTTDALASAARELATEYGARVAEIIGDDLLAANFPLVHAVGRASSSPPRLIDFVWGETNAPKVTLVGKGVVFDTGGLNIKPDSSMLLMRKDMGGAASALTAARIIMASGLKVRLRVILPIVENAISGSAFRPGDIYPSRKGISVEIGNTDAEGRLILADALALADEEKPDLLIDFATLTGAARVALGPDLPPFYTDNDALADQIGGIGADLSDPVWRLPLWKPYQSMLDSKYADMNNVGAGGFAGSITAALFLRRFVTETNAYAHFDIFGWVPSAKPGRPEGGEPQAARLVADLVAKRFA